MPHRAQNCISLVSRKNAAAWLVLDCEATLRSEVVLRSKARSHGEMYVVRDQL